VSTESRQETTMEPAQWENRQTRWVGFKQKSPAASKKGDREQKIRPGDQSCSVGTFQWKKTEAPKKSKGGKKEKGDAEHPE